jgi:AcrR family transcriptional regulator
MNFNDKQVQIINIAEELFASRGFEGTSVRDIAEAAGINIAMISYYFGSKEKLMEAIFELRTGHIKMKVESLINDNSLDHFEKMYHLIDDHISRVVENTRFYKIMVTEQLVNKNCSLTEAVKQVKKKNTEIIAELIDLGVKAGAFREVKDIPLLMNTLIGTVAQTMLNESFYREYHHIENLEKAEYQEFIKKTLSNHIRQIFKSMLSK